VGIFRRRRPIIDPVFADPADLPDLPPVTRVAPFPDLPLLTGITSLPDLPVPRLRTRPQPDTTRTKENTMGNITQILDDLLTVEGATAVALVDSTSGMVLGQKGAGLDLDIAAAGNTEVIRAKLATIKALGLRDTIDDILITLTTQYHVIRPLADNPTVFLYLVLDRSRANLAMGRYKVAASDNLLVI
jgi:hypothetical protein